MRQTSPIEREITDPGDTVTQQRGSHHRDAGPGHQTPVGGAEIGRGNRVGLLVHMLADHGGRQDAFLAAHAEHDPPVGDVDQSGSDDAQLDSPEGVACDKEGNVYVADRGNARVAAFKPAGAFYIFPEAPNNDGSAFVAEAIKNNVIGTRIVADATDRYGGTHFVMTGYDNRNIDNGGLPSRPSMGSICSRVRGPNNQATGMPTYVRMGGIGSGVGQYIAVGRGRHAPLRVGDDAGQPGPAPSGEPVGVESPADPVRHSSTSATARSDG